MGYHLAGHVTRKVQAEGGEMLVWNRTHSKAQTHAAEFGSSAVTNLEELSRCDVVLTCLPTTEHVAEVSLHVVSQTSSVGIWVDCTSGDPAKTRKLGAALAKQGVQLVDCPVSGGPRGAKEGIVATMLGGDENAVNEVMPLIRTFSPKMWHCGPIGSGMAVKTVNNVLNSAHLAAAAEGLLALRAAGVDPERALAVINASSGRSLQTQVRIPEEVLSRRFGYGFKLGLMRKDCEQASKVLAENFPQATILHTAVETMRKAEQSLGGDGDYTQVVAYLEGLSGVTLAGA